MRLSTLLLGICSLFLWACPSSSSTSEDLKELPYAGTKAEKNEVVVHELSDPDKLNPITSQGAGATYIEHSLFMYLLDVDKEKLDVLPWLAKERPTITIIDEGEYAGGLQIDYEIRPEAKWDNGTPVTGHDVDFSFKATKNPLVDAENNRPYIDFIQHIEVDTENPKKLSMYSKEPHFAAEFSSGGTIYIVPEYIYDPNKLMQGFTLKQLSDEDQVDHLRGDPDIIAFAESFNSEKHQREKGFVVGCGPYNFEEWTTGQRIVLSKKENWWGNQLDGTKSFENAPSRIVYEIINDKVTAITAMKDESIDVMRGFRPKDFHDLQSDYSFNEKYFLFNPTFLSYSYIGVNMKHPALKEKDVRKALAHLIDVEQLIDVLYYGYANTIASFVHPSKSYCNKELQPYEFNIQTAVDYLENAGWTDSNSDGIRDKVIDGEMVSLKLTIKYNSGNDVREKICLLMKENARQAGIELEILVKEWSVYLEECKDHNFDLYVLGWVQEAVLDDPKQLFHTESYNGGSNYVGFGNAYSDELIETLRKEMDEEKRAQYYKELQALIWDEVPYIFLYTPDNLVAISKRYGEAKSYVARPGYEERELVLAPFKGASAEI